MCLHKNIVHVHAFEYIESEKTNGYRSLAKKKNKKSVQFVFLTAEDIIFYSGFDGVLNRQFRYIKTP